MPKLFCYGTLNVHEIQRILWGEVKDGIHVRLLDYELKIWPQSSIFYIEPRIGESVVGKMYNLSKKQLKTTDRYEGPSYKREKIETEDEDFFVYVGRVKKNKEAPVEKGAVGGN